jgi:outer membrane protein insertion porin family
MLSRLVILILCFATSLKAAKIEFAGLETYSAKSLTGAISGRLEFIKKRPATTFRADDAAFLIESFLQSHGLPDATVDWSLPGDDRILLTVNEGVAKYVGTATIIGADKPEELIEQFTAPFPESGERRAFVAGAVASGLDRVRSLMESRGYWQASVTSTRGARNATGEFPFTVTVNKGPLYTLVPPKIDSPVKPTANLLARLKDQAGDTASAENILSARKTIDEDYRRRGYPDLNIEMAKESDGSRLRLVFTIEPGQRFKVRSLNIKTQGPNKTNLSRVRNRFPDLIGKNFNERKINESIKKLLSTGAFETIRLETTEASDTQLDLTLHLTEAKARGYSFSAGFGSFEGFILGARYHDRNFGGRLWNLTAGTEITSLGILGEVGLTDPFFLERDWRFHNRAYLVTRDFDNYRKLEGGVSSDLSWKNGEHYSASLGAQLSFSSVSSPIPDELIGPSDYALQRISFNQTYDLRDDPALPSNGWFARLDTSIGLALGDQSVGFLESEAQISYYKKLSEKSAYSAGLRAGIIIPTGDDEDLPIDLRKFLGGSNTIRSFPEREMGPDFDGYPLGGNTWWVSNFEYTRTLTGPVKGVAFFDAGALDAEIEMAVGLGIRIDLPVGPIRLEYGHSLTKDPGEPGGTFHFAIGTTF